MEEWTPLSTYIYIYIYICGGGGGVPKVYTCLEGPENEKYSISGSILESRI